jgi:hypothetical protein
MRMDGGEAKAFTKGKRSVRELAWSPDGKTIAFLAPDTASDAENKKEKDKNDAQVVDKDDRHARLWVQSIACRRSREATRGRSRRRRRR